MDIIKKTDVSFGEDMEKLELSYTTDGNVKWSSHFGNSLAVPQKVRTTKQLSNSTAM